MSSDAADEAPGGPIQLGRVLDDACTAILEAGRRGSLVTELRVNPAVHRTIATLRAKELDAGSELMVLGLRLVAAPDVPVDGSEIR